MRLLRRAWIIIGAKAIVIAVLAGCVSSRPIGVGGVDAVAGFVSKPITATNVLPLVGLLATGGGIIALVITRGGMGMRGIVIGVLLVILADLMQRFSMFLYVPILVGSAAVSLAYAWRIVRRAIKERQTWKSGGSSVARLGDSLPGRGLAQGLAKWLRGFGSGVDERNPSKAEVYEATASEPQAG